MPSKPAISTGCPVNPIRFNTSCHITDKRETHISLLKTMCLTEIKINSLKNEHSVIITPIMSLQIKNKKIKQLYIRN